MNMYMGLVLVVLLPGSIGIDVRSEYYRIDERYSDVLPVSNILWTNTKTVMRCGLECYTDAACESFFYDNGNCLGYVRKLHDKVATTVAMGTRYYEMAGPVGNVAAGMPTSQSSNLYDEDFGSRLAVDSRRYPVQNAPVYIRSCSHTKMGGRGDDSPFWEVDLLTRHQIHSMAFLSRIECCGERNTGLNITVAETSGGPYALCYYYPEGIGFVGEMKRFVCTQPVTGRVVRITRDLPILNPCEIEVYGSPLN